MNQKCHVALMAFLMCPAATAGDWPDYRGPLRDGKSAEKNLPSSWKLNGDNFLWRVPFGGRSAPIIMGDRVYLLLPVGENETRQERVVCLDANTGKLIWEHRYSVFLSDVPPRRVAWSSPAADPETGNVYVFGVGGSLIALSRDGKVLWEHSLAEEFGLITTHGGRTVSPVVQDGLVVISGITSGWGNQARLAHRFFAFDKNTGECVWVSSPGSRPYDTVYSPAVIADLAEQRILIDGGGDGAIHAIKLMTGEPVWKYEVSKRGINTGVILNGTTAIVTHSEENLDTNDMGLIAAIDATAKGTIGKEQIKWAIKGFQGGFSTQLLDGDRVYQIDNGANLFAFDAQTGRTLWRHNLGTIQKATPVLADGKLYVGTENGKFFIVRPGQEGAAILSEEWLGSAQNPEPILASAAVSGGRVFFVSESAIYCIGRKNPNAESSPSLPAQPAGSGPVAVVQVIPAEVLLSPGESIRFRVRRFDSHARLIGEGQAALTLDRLRGTLSQDGSFKADAAGIAQAGEVKATIDGVTGSARVRVVPPLPWNQNFDSLADKSTPATWINSAGKFEVREMEGTKVLAKLADNPATKRARVFMGPTSWSNYSIEADVRATEKRRQMGDAGVVAQRYSLTLFGNNQRLELQSWQPEPTRTVSAPFAIKPDTWYRLKLRVEPATGGKVRARGKAWLASDPEPNEWLLDRVDPVPNRNGSPGIYADAPYELFFDNLKVTPNL